MAEIVDILLRSGKSAVELSLYILLPVMVVMLALMKLLEAKGGLAFIARLLTPVFRPFGIPGIGIFAILQSLLVSFAAPVATLSIMENDETPKRQIAATLAMVLTVSQANVVFPLITVGLNVWIILMTSLVGGASAAAATYYYFARSENDGPPTSINQIKVLRKSEQDILSVLVDGGQEGVQIALKAIPILVLAICLVNFLKPAGVAALMEWALSPILRRMHLPGSAVLPIVTKYVAGGTAMMGITVPLVREGSITSLELNRMAGFVINPLDFVGVAVLVSAGRRVGSVLRPAVMGAAVGILVRGILHLIIF